MKQFLFILVAVALLGASLIQAASPGDVLLVEIGADPASAAGINEPAGEFIELYNNTSSAINLNSWTISDNGTTVVTLPDITLDPGRILVIIADSDTLGTTNGYSCASGASTPLHHQPTAWFSNNLSNNGDYVILKDNLGNTIDSLSYGSDASVFDPSAPDVFNNSGATLQRATYNTAFIDTNTASDWGASATAGNPCDVGPTAISLSNLGATTSSATALPALGLLALGGAALYRRRRG